MTREEWEILTEVEVEGKRQALVPGAEFKVKGERGTSYVFKELVTHPSGQQWITAWGGTYKHEQWVSFPVDVDITKVKAPPRKK